MANVVISAPNFIDSDFYRVAFSGGSWAASLPLSNLAVENFAKLARSSSAATADTQGEVYLGTTRDIRVLAFPKHNISRSGEYRIRYSNTPRWQGATVNANASLGASSFVILAGSTTLNLSSGDHLQFEGHDTVYRCTTTATVAPAGTQTVNITPNLTAAIASTDTVTCISGDYTTPAYDTGWIDAIGQIYEYPFPEYGAEEFWDGKPTDEQLSKERFPIVIVHPSTIRASFVKFEFEDTSNAAGYLDFPRLFISPGWQPTLNAVFGSSQSFSTSTIIDETVNGRRIYQPKPTRREFTLTFSDLSVAEVYSSIFDVLRQDGVHRQVFVVFDPDDTAQLHRRAFTATVKELPAITYDYTGGTGNGEVYTAVSLSFQFLEVIA